MFHNKTIFVNSFDNLCKILSTNYIKPSYLSTNTSYYGGTSISLKSSRNKYIMFHYNISKLNFIIIWKIDIQLNYWYTDFLSSNQSDHIASFDYTIEKDTIKINNLKINNKLTNSASLSDEKSIKIKKAFFNYIDTISKDDNKKIIK